MGKAILRQEQEFDLVNETEMLLEVIGRVPTSHKAAHAREFPTSIGLTRKNSSGEKEEILEITFRQQDDFTCDLKSDYFPDWAIEEIRKLESKSTRSGNGKKLVAILREALVDMEDLIALDECKEPPQVFDWDDVEHEFLGHDESQTKNRARSPRAAKGDTAIVQKADSPDN